MASSADSTAELSSDVQQQPQQTSTQDSNTEPGVQVVQKPVQTVPAPKQTDPVQAVANTKPNEDAASTEGQSSMPPAPPSQVQPAPATGPGPTIDNRLSVPLIDVYLWGTKPQDKLILHITLTMLIAWAIQFLLRVITFAWSQLLFWYGTRWGHDSHPLAAICGLAFFLAYLSTEPILFVAFLTKSPIWATVYFVRNCINTLWLIIFPIVALGCQYIVYSNGLQRCETMSPFEIIFWWITTWLEAIIYVGFAYVSLRFRAYLCSMKTDNKP